MNQLNGLEKSIAFISCQLQAGRRRLNESEDPGAIRAITISRQTGSGGHSIAEKLAELLQSQGHTGASGWAVFDRNLVERVLQDHNLPARLARFMPEDRVSEIDDIMDELFGLHPPSWILARKTSETILNLVQLGHVIVIGRGGNIVTSRLPHVLHVRLVGTLAARVKRQEQINASSPKEAVRQVVREDLARERYVKQFFGKNIDDPLLSHLVLNTDLISVNEAAIMIARFIESKAIAFPA
jgi:cytidylate kinase